VEGRLDNAAAPRKGDRRKIRARLRCRPHGLCWTVAASGDNRFRMSDRPDDKKKQDNREERLRAALRANLQRRKAQARARATQDGDGQQDSDTGKDDE
jgi:hypothetical protein